MDEQEVRAQIVEAMAEAMYEHPIGQPPGLLTWEKTSDAVRERTRYEVSVGLDAALAVRVQGPCPECKGTGQIRYEVSRGHRLPGVIGTGFPAFDPCHVCKGSGTVSSDVPAIVGLLMEQVGWRGENGEWTVDERRAAMLQGAVPVYRIRDESVGSIPPGDAK